MNELLIVSDHASLRQAQHKLDALWFWKFFQEPEQAFGLRSQATTFLSSH